jgi:hypothetical protein
MVRFFEFMNPFLHQIRLRNGDKFHKNYLNPFSTLTLYLMKRVSHIFCFFLLTIFSVAQGYSVFQDNGKVGLKNESGKVLIPAKYDALGWSEGEFSVLNNVTGYQIKGKWGLISLSNHIVAKAEFEEIAPVDATYLIVRKKSPLSLRTVTGIMSASGKEIVPFEYDDIQLSALRAIVLTKIGNQYKHGLIDLENRILIPQQFKSIKAIGSLRYAVENFEGKTAIYTDAGKQITSFSIDSISPYKKNYAIIYQGLHQGVIDRDGIVKVQPGYREIKIEDDGSIFTRQPSTWLFLDGQNKLTQKVEADSVEGLKKNLLKVSTSGTIQLTEYNLNPISSYRVSSLGKFIKEKAIFSVGNKYGLIRSNGKVVLEPTYSGLVQDGIYLIARTHQAGKDNCIVLDSIGKPLHTKVYERIHSFNGKFFPVTNRNYWGAIDASGKEIVSCTYDSVIQQYNENIVVKFHGEYGIINQREAWIVPPRTSRLRLVTADRFIEYGPKVTYLKAFDNSIIYFSENKLEVKGERLVEHLPSGGMWEIDMHGIIVDRKVMPEMVDEIFPETEGLRGIKRNGQYGFIDSQGRLRIANRYELVRPFSEQLAAMKIRGKWGFIGHDDHIAIQPTYDQVSDFKNGFSIVYQKGFQGVIDGTGKQILPPRYEQVSILPHRNIIIQQNKLLGLADERGRVLINPRYSKLTDLNNGYVIVERDGKYGAVTLQNISTIPLIYDYLSYDSIHNTFLAMTKSAWTKVSF